MARGYPIKNRLRKYRKQAGLTQAEVAAHLGLSSSTQVSRWERGERIPSLIYALKLSALFHRLVTDIFYEMFDEEREAMFEDSDPSEQYI